MIDPLTIADVDALLARYLRALDQRNMREWADLFSAREDAAYFCVTRENADADYPVALMMDDNRARIEDRVTYVTKIWEGTFQDYQTRHLAQRVDLSGDPQSGLEVLSHFTVFETAEETGVARLLTTGTYEDVLIQERDEWRFLSRRAVLDTAVLPRYVVYPV